MRTGDLVETPPREVPGLCRRSQLQLGMDCQHDATAEPEQYALLLCGAHVQLVKKGCLERSRSPLDTLDCGRPHALYRAKPSHHNALVQVFEHL